VNAPAVAPGVTTLAVCIGELITGSRLLYARVVGGGGRPPEGGGGGSPMGGSPILGTLVGCGG